MSERSSREVAADIAAVNHEIKANRQHEEYLFWRRQRTRGWRGFGLFGRTLLADAGLGRLEKRRDALQRELRFARTEESRGAKEAEWQEQRRRRDEEQERRDLGCPPDRSLDEHRQFLAEKKRVAEEHTVPLHVRTWEELRAWERWGRDAGERSMRLQEAQSRGGLEERDREWDLMRLEYGIVSREDYRAQKAQKQRREELAQMREDIHYVENVCDDPDELYTGHWAKDNKELEAWSRRRPQLENELDALEAQAMHEDRELDPEEQEMVSTLAELRDAEDRAREAHEERRAAEEERRLEGPEDDDGLSLA